MKTKTFVEIDPWGFVVKRKVDASTGRRIATFLLFLVVIGNATTVITSDTTLTGDNDDITINASGVTLDCGGFIVSNNIMSNYGSTTIRNCIVKGSASGDGACIGVPQISVVGNNNLVEDAYINRNCNGLSKFVLSNGANNRADNVSGDDGFSEWWICGGCGHRIEMYNQSNASLNAVRWGFWSYAQTAFTDKNCTSCSFNNSGNAYNQNFLNMSSMSMKNFNTAAGGVPIIYFDNVSDITLENTDRHISITNSNNVKVNNTSTTHNFEINNSIGDYLYNAAWVYFNNSQFDFIENSTSVTLDSSTYGTLTNLNNLTLVDMNGYTFDGLNLSIGAYLTNSSSNAFKNGYIGGYVTPGTHVLSLDANSNNNNFTNNTFYPRYAVAAKNTRQDMISITGDSNIWSDNVFNDAPASRTFLNGKYFIVQNGAENNLWTENIFNASAHLFYISNASANVTIYRNGYERILTGILDNCATEPCSYHAPNTVQGVVPFVGGAATKWNSSIYYGVNGSQYPYYDYWDGTPTNYGNFYYNLTDAEPLANISMSPDANLSITIIAPTNASIVYDPTFTVQYNITGTALRYCYLAISANGSSFYIINQYLTCNASSQVVSTSGFTAGQQNMIVGAYTDSGAGYATGYFTYIATPTPAPAGGSAQAWWVPVNNTAPPDAAEDYINPMQGIIDNIQETIRDILGYLPEIPFLKDLIAWLKQCMFGISNVLWLLLAVLAWLYYQSKKGASSNLDTTLTIIFIFAAIIIFFTFRPYIDLCGGIN